MESVTDIVTRNARNEQLLSGMAALVGLAGVVFSPIGAGLRRLSLRDAGMAAF